MHQSIASGGRGGWELTEVKGEGEEEKGEDRSAWRWGEGVDREEQRRTIQKGQHVSMRKARKVGWGRREGANEWGEERRQKEGKKWKRIKAAD